VVWDVLRVTESALKNVSDTQTCWIFTIRNPDVWRGTPETKTHLVCRLSRETKQYSTRKLADRRQKHNKHSHGTAQKHWTAEKRISLSNCGNSRSVHTTCPVKRIYSQILRDFARFPVFTVRKSVCVWSCAVCHITQYRSKTDKSRIFVLVFVVSRILKIFLDLKKLLVCTQHKDAKLLPSQWVYMMVL